eukprot:Opistho-2@17933
MVAKQKKARIVLEVYRPSHPDGYAPGDVVEGHVLIAKKTTLRSLCVSLVGKDHVHWDRRVEGRVEPVGRTDTIVKEKRQVLIGSEPYAPGSRIPFSIQLPGYLKPSVGVDATNEVGIVTGEIYYYLKGTQLQCLSYRILFLSL